MIFLRQEYKIRPQNDKSATGQYCDICKQTYFRPQIPQGFQGSVRVPQSFRTESMLKTEAVPQYISQRSIKPFFLDEQSKYRTFERNIKRLWNKVSGKR